MSDLAKAILLIAEIRDALARGTKHFAVDGRELRTEQEILAALLADGRIQFQPKEGA